MRYTTGRIQAQVAGWKIDYKNRIVTSFNPDLGISIDRNVGKVDTYGFDADIAFRPVRSVMLLAFGSYIHARLKDNVQIGTLAAGQTCDSNPLPSGCAPTAGKMVAETPKWQFGGRAQYEAGPFTFGVQGKHVGSRFATDVNDVKVKGYDVVDLDVRFAMDTLGLKKTFLQLNLQNVFDQFYFGSISTQINAGGNPNFAVGSPRTLSATLNVAF
jgi:iron complex outermembrane receptor protein